MQYFAKIIKMPFFWPKIPKFGHLGSKFEKQKLVENSKFFQF